MDDNILELGKQLAILKKDMFNSIKPSIDYIINNNIQDVNLIERTLDCLLDCCYDDESINCFNELCEYYGLIDKNGEKFYKTELKKLYSD